MVTLPGALGQMGVLRGHAPLLSTLDIGEIMLHRREGKFIAVSGGVVEVRPDKVTILADTAEAGARSMRSAPRCALDARREASWPKTRRRRSVPEMEAAMRRSSLRLKVARRHQGRRATEGLNLRGRPVSASAS
jgi:F-type H+-transporting ATPase subunit epsilon